ncbi:MAG TPA: translesion error-prone DNA polymerase V autoproteolytic subunit [Methylophilaceae bacterium]|nr:translesion error-prone DNA polymerase V autoproteolytic subunit [Methylophilaceae bacterium]
MHGGKRPNSGPKKSMSPYGESSFVMRIPVSLKPAIQEYLAEYKQRLGYPIPNLEGFTKAAPNPIPLTRPVYSGTVAAGQSRFPSPAQDYELETLDLNKRFISTPAATYFFQVKGDSMREAGILDGATAVVNASLKPKSSNIVVAAVEGEWLIKRLYKRGNVVKLLSENPAYPPIEFQEGQELIIFGVVEHVINPTK